MPLFDDEWAEGKCAYKLIQYMACGIPVVASHVGANIDVVTPECGFLARTTQDWVRSLEVLCDRPEIRLEMGEAGRGRVQRYFSLEANVQKLAKAIRGSVREFGVAKTLRRAPGGGSP
jgi:glycosyltransferase involved in cell wall biosynthesis